jgi:hypothetical protein
LEPHRAKWTDAKSKGGDIYGWDYFDYEACPDSEIYPCSDAERLVYQKELYALKTLPLIQTSDATNKNNVKKQLPIPMSNASPTELSSSPGNTTVSSPRNKRDVLLLDALLVKESRNENNVKKQLPIRASNSSEMELSPTSLPGNT